MGVSGTTESWLAKVLERYPENAEKYDYSRVAYTKTDEKVSIGCLRNPNEHGFFDQRPYDHLRGKGCKKCHPNAKRTTESWLAKVLEKYPENAKKYDYSRVNYENDKKKVKIVCRRHPERGFFEKRPSAHLSGEGCPECWNERRGDKLRSSKGEWLVKVFERYPENKNWYDYSQANYEDCMKEVNIVCLRNLNHGTFKQSPNSHLNGRGCRKCSGNDKGTTESWLAKVLEKYPENADKYDYSQVVYENSKKKVKILCRRHPERGFFEQTPNNHLTTGQGCKKCGNESRGDSGFSYGKPAYYYVHRVIKNEEFLCYKAGISHDWKRRLGQLRRGCGPEYDFEPVEQVYYEKGAEAWEFEQEMLKKKDIRAPVLDIEGGTELFLENPLTTIINRTQT